MSVINSEEFNILESDFAAVTCLINMDDAFAAEVEQTLSKEVGDTELDYSVPSEYPFPFNDTLHIEGQTVNSFHHIKFRRSWLPQQP